MLKLGITGNIGSGKSTVARLFNLLGIPVYDADSRAKAVMIEDFKLVAQIKKLLGVQAYFPDGSLNRKYISSKVFGNQNLLNSLNAIVHPAVFNDFDLWVNQQSSQFILKEAALLFESGSYKSLDKILVVSAPEELRIKRVVQRDNCTKEEALQRMNKQMPQDEKERRADFIIRNDEKILLIPQVVTIVNQLTA